MKQKLIMTILILVLIGISCKDNPTDTEKDETITDIDGNVYQTIKIGDQLWMMGNLKVTRYRNGDTIPNITDNTEWNGLYTGAYCAYENDDNIAKTYGLLYNWYAVQNNSNLAPQGWHVPTTEEWIQLEEYLGSNAGGKLKEQGTSHWNAPNSNATNSSGFTALPGGLRYSSFYRLGKKGYLWSTTVHNSDSARTCYLDYNSSEIQIGYENKLLGFSIRCVKD